MSPPSSIGKSSEKARSRASDTITSISDDTFFSAGSGSNGSNTQTSIFYSMSSFTCALTGTEDGIRTGLIADETVELLSGSGTNITGPLSFRGTTSASMLCDSPSGSSGLHPLHLHRVVAWLDQEGCGGVARTLRFKMPRQA
ncbi:hypothetical protein A0H81_01420 [Grifola frondosa]|uniref:Uncharacterized protein n=1 Tax=Grifola frondosa TaxID=5627 RepID=A0A1C7MVT3_GRIFR|nr:hypothetical protein A0H81_01420 [Grifola frondosa]